MVNQAEHEIDTIARYLSNEVAGDFVFDGNDHGDAPDFYRTHAIALMRTMRSLGWREPARLVGPVLAPPMPDNAVVNRSEIPPGVALAEHYREKMSAVRHLSSADENAIDDLLGPGSGRT